ncbi:MAG: SPOR domain-containing protein [Burkholderiales bacterium]|nr:SPOR domain-containing protein [Burkholderiales bacterium]
MNAAVKPTRRRSASTRATPSRDAGGTLLGIFIGLVLGLGLAAGVAYYLMKANGPFPVQASKDARETAREAPRSARAEAAAPDKEKPRFDFYKILPGVEEPKVQAEARRPAAEKAVADVTKAAAEKGTDKAGEQTAKAPAPKVVEKAPDKVASAEPTSASKLPERFWLQAGSFASESDAENLKARLAFAGWQASVQQGTLPDKGTRFRVRLGPYNNPDEVNRIRSDLARNGFEVAVIRF